MTSSSLAVVLFPGPARERCRSCSPALVAGVAAAPEVFTSTATLTHPSEGNRQQSRAPAGTE